MNRKHYGLYYHLKDKDLIELSAQQLGNYHKPAYYAKHIEEHYNRKVSISNIVKTLGSYKMRIKQLDSVIKQKISELLELASNDTNLIFNLIRRFKNDDGVPRRH